MTGSAAKPRMTDDQARATEPWLTAWVGASAGTGKTHVLTARVLRLMLTGTHPENILCLTFTKAAAAEMKNRIFAELGRWALMDDSTLAAEINRRTEEFADEDMLIRARQLFAEVLDLSGGLQIQTFHSFCQALLGRFPLEAGMAPGFDGMDEAEARELMATARDQMLAVTRLERGADVRAALDKVASLVTEQTFDEVIDRLSFEASNIRAASDAYGGVMGMTAALYRVLGLEQAEKAEAVIAAAVRDDAFDRDGVHALMTGMLAGSAAEQKTGQVLADFLATEEHLRAVKFAGYMAVFLTQKGEPRARVANKPTLTANPGLESVIEKEQARLMRLSDRLKSIELAEATTALIKLGIAQLALYRHMKTERGLVDFDDMIGRTVGLLDRAEVAPWILFKLDSAIDHIMVDEAQDTNADQWRVVETLAAEFFAGESASGKVRTLFAVGDAKQSIFSFQRADPREFVTARNRVFARASAAEYAAETVPLNLSFRSGAAVLGLVDAVFHEEAVAYNGLSADGEIVRHDYIRKGHGGLVELWPLEEPSPEAEDAAEDEGWVPPLFQEGAHDAEQRTAWRIARRIRDMLDTGEMLEAQGRPIRAGDILVLVRRRTAFVDHLVKALKATGIPVAGRDRMVLTDELPVMDLLALAHFALLPEDDLTLATVLKSPFIGMDDDALYQLAFGRKGSLWQALAARADTPAFATAYAFLSDVLKAADTKTPFEFLSHVLTDLGGRVKLAARLGSEIHDPIDELLEEALRFEYTSAAALQAFVHRVEHGGTQIKRDMEAAGEVVRIMTAHSAKGLQAPIVFLSDLVGLPDATRETRILPLPSGVPGRPPLLVWTSPAKDLAFIEDMKTRLKQNQLAEYRRLLYVALTRAEDRLYVAGWQGKDKPSDDCWFKAIEAGFDRLGALDVQLSADRIAKRYHVAQTAPVAGPAKALAGRAEAPPLPRWLHSPMPAEPVPPRPLAPSMPDDEEPAVLSPLVARGKDRFLRGRVIHALLEWLPDMPPPVRESAALAYLGRQPEVPASERLPLWREVEGIMMHPDFGALFGPGSKAEVPIAGLVGGRVISGQVDRLVVTPGEVLIVDYKTNRPPPADVRDVAPLYLKQMGLYVRALGEVYGGRPIRAALLWTNEAKLMELPKDLMDEALKSLGL